MPSYHRASTAAPIFSRWKLLQRLNDLPGVSIRKKHHYGLWTVYEIRVAREWYWHAKPKLVELPFYKSLDDPHTDPDVAQNWYELSRYMQDKGLTDEELIHLGYYPRSRASFDAYMAKQEALKPKAPADLNGQRK